LVRIYIRAQHSWRKITSSADREEGSLDGEVILQEEFG